MDNGIFIYNYRINNSLTNNIANLNGIWDIYQCVFHNKLFNEQYCKYEENGIHIASNYNSLSNNTANNNSNAGIYLIWVK